MRPDRFRNTPKEDLEQEKKMNNKEIPKRQENPTLMDNFMVI